MKKLVLLFSHTLTQSQINEVKSKFDVTQIVFLPDNLQNMWSNVPSDLDSLHDYLIPFKKFLSTNTNSQDVVLIQGDFGAVFQIVNFCKSKELKTIYATTKRVVEDVMKNNQTIKKSIFEHGRFREYE